MKPYKIEIQLLSDLCVSDGGVYNSSIHIDVCYDDLGFPYIPAKRLKGCLRECAEELNDWGIRVPSAHLFGKEGNQPGTVRICNAYLEKDQQYRQEVLENQGFVLTHPQNVLREFSYVRTQTAINYDTGAADHRSLRTMRVVNKGLRFFAEVTLPEEDVSALEQCCKVLKHLGIGKTRGLGEVCVRLIEDDRDERPVMEACPWVDGATRLDYEILLTEPMMCKWTGGDETGTEDYIEGAKILGLIAQASKKDGEDAFLRLMGDGELICSNAYLSNGGTRLLPVPACYYSVKHDKRICIDKTSLGYDEKKHSEKQLQMMKGSYIRDEGDGRLSCNHVQIEEHYHHRRPEDKAIGRATGLSDDEGILYQIASISAGQTFKGMIVGHPVQIKKVYRYLKSQPQIHLGAGRNAEYGKASLRLTGCGKEAEEREQAVTRFQVKLESPLILYGDNAAYTTEVKTLIEEINTVLQLNKEEIEDITPYVATVTVGGYQVTWGMKKPTLEAFDKGSVLYYRMKKPIDISGFSGKWIGERVGEGYGEVTVSAVAEGGGEREIIAIDTYHSEKEILDIRNSEFLRQLCFRLFSDYVTVQGLRAGAKSKIVSGPKEVLKSVVNYMLSLCETKGSFADIEKEYQERFNESIVEKKQKREICKEILNDCKDICQKLPDSFRETFKIEGYEWDAELIRKVCLKAYLLEIRYLLRQ